MHFISFVHMFFCFVFFLLSRTKVYRQDHYQAVNLSNDLKNHNLIIEILCMYLLNNNNSPNYLHMLSNRYFYKGWCGLTSHLESRIFFPFQTMRDTFSLSSFHTNHLIYNRVWNGHGNDKAILWHRCSNLKVGQQPLANKRITLGQVPKATRNKIKIFSHFHLK